MSPKKWKKTVPAEGSRLTKVGKSKALAKVVERLTRACVEQMKSRIRVKRIEVSLWNGLSGKASVKKWVVMWAWKEHVPGEKPRMNQRRSGKMSLVAHKA